MEASGPPPFRSIDRRSGVTGGRTLGSTVAGLLTVVGVVSVVTAAATLAIVTALLVRQIDRTHLNEHAAMIAACLTPAAGGDLAASVLELQSRYPRLLAVALLDASGGLRDVLPQHPTARALAKAAPPDASEFTLSQKSTGTEIRAIGVRVPLNGDLASDAQRALILFSRRDPPTGYWSAVAGMGLVFALISAAMFAGAHAWLKVRLAGPLRSVVDLLNAGVDCGLDGPTPRDPRVTEIEQLSRGVAALRGKLAAEADRVQQIEDSMQRELQQRLCGLDRQLRQARDMATLDPLTGLRNRAFLESELEKLFECSRGATTDLAAVMIDLDNFKRYNDRHGHHAGDALLRYMGELLRGCIRPADHAMRYGGDEFLILLPGTTAKEGRTVADRIVKLFAQYTGRLAQPHILSMSAGVSSRNHGLPSSGHDLVAQADAAMYAAKRQGKNRVAAHVPANRAAELSRTNDAVPTTGHDNESAE